MAAVTVRHSRPGRVGLTSVFKTCPESVDQGAPAGVLGYNALDFDSRRFVPAVGGYVLGARDGEQLLVR
jgi:hypothetical protein